MAGVKAEAHYCAVIPILNKGCAIPSTLPLAISPSITFRKIRGDDLAIITEEDEDASSLIKGGTYTLTVDPYLIEDGILPLAEQISAAVFSINVLGTGLPISVDRVYVTRSLRKMTLHSTHQLNGHRHPNVGKFEIASGTDLAAVPEVFSAVCSALKTHPPLSITLSRFNSSMGRVALDDRLIDLCIALESIFQSQTEISFQFALYNSLLSEEDAEKRVSIFSALKKLYQERSNIVHGNKELDSDWVTEKWNDLIRIAKTTILKKVEFLSSRDHTEWKRELQNLALGVPRNGPEVE